MDHSLGETSLKLCQLIFDCVNKKINTKKIYNFSLLTKTLTKKPNLMNATYAGFWLRFVAVIIDGILIAIVRSLLVLPILGVMGIGLAHDVQHLDTEDPSSVLPIVGTIIAFAGISMLISTVIWVLYYTLMESSKYQATVGKLALGLIVTDESGNKLDFAKALIRNLCKIISSMIMCIGYIMAGFTEKKQGLHDIIAKTLVVKKP
ncbi:MAG: Serine/threonine protein kinase [Cytophagales bacterium]|jgi:uncharacterized RDD family membrane protein YckC|nr:MAG: Serine/threonine protein kinase [Cytophagales bacterium]